MKRAPGADSPADGDGRPGAPRPRRRYRLGARAAAKQATRERILDAVGDAMRTRWYDELTLAELAAAAGVSSPTLTNHFGGKLGLVAAWGRERFSAEIGSVRDTVEPGDLPGAIGALVADYERSGDVVVRVLALEHRLPELTPVLDAGRAAHREWVGRAFGPRLPRSGREREERITQLLVATDVYAWQRLRRDGGLSRRATTGTLLALVTAVVGAGAEGSA